jgi:ligand-binding sensor domain-containing protein
VLFDGANWQTFHSGNSGLPLNLVRTVAIENSIVWIGTEGQGLSIFDYSSNSWQNFSTANSTISSNYLSKIERATTNQKWIATANGIDVR